MWLGQLIFANLVHKILQSTILVVVQDSQVALERLHRVSKIEVEAEFDQNF